MASVRLLLSYTFDWIVIIGLGVVSYFMGHVTPNKRPFSLSNRDISLPFTTAETVPAIVAALLNTLVPIVLVFVVCLVFVPGPTVPPNTPKSLIWKRKLWELHAGWLGLGLAVSSAFFITNGMKNMFGKPRPDLLARCQPDLENLAKYIIGGNLIGQMDGRLVSPDICTNTDKSVLDDGFRSFPSGHSSSSSAGLIYLSLFLASKFAVTIPHATQPSGPIDHDLHAAFPSRLGSGATTLSADTASLDGPNGDGTMDNKHWDSITPREASMNKEVRAVRRQAAAPPIYLLIAALFPFFLSVFIASTRWFDFRHHGFDIMFGYLIGVACSIFSFRVYHLPISSGAGWAWAPRSSDRAFWAGVGCYSYAMHNNAKDNRGGEEEEAIGMVTLARGQSTGRDDHHPLPQDHMSPTPDSNSPTEIERGRDHSTF